MVKEKNTKNNRVKFVAIGFVVLGLVSGVAIMNKSRLLGYINPSRVFVTGNLHGKLGIERLSEENFKEQLQLTIEDNLIILGDFGLVWDNHIEDEFILDELAKKNYKILFVDGTRENFDLLEEYEEVDLYGGKARKIRENIFHLKRGEVYTIGGKKYAVMGGGISEDINVRKEGLTYWKKEKPNEYEWKNFDNNLDRENFYVDYILTHTPPSKDLRFIGAEIGRNLGDGNEVSQSLQDVSEKVKYKKWFHGYYHLDLEISGKHKSVYNEIIEITK